MPLHDPLIAQQYGGQEAYERLVDDGTFYRPDAISNMRPIDQLRYARNVVLGTAALALGTGLEAYGFAITDPATLDGAGPVMLGAFPLAIASYIYMESTPSIMARYQTTE